LTEISIYSAMKQQGVGVDSTTQAKNWQN